MLLVFRSEKLKKEPEQRKKKHSQVRGRHTRSINEHHGEKKTSSNSKSVHFRRENHTTLTGSSWPKYNIGKTGCNMILNVVYAVLVCGNSTALLPLPLLKKTYGLRLVFQDRKAHSAIQAKCLNVEIVCFPEGPECLYPTDRQGYVSC